jgi:predicted MFS family arabinose efflux permease
VGLAQSATTFVVVFGALGRRVPPERRGLAFGLVTAGGSVGMFAFVPLAQLLVSGVGWQSALQTLAAIALLPIALAPLLGGRPAGAAAVPSDVAPGLALAAASRHPGYLLLTLGFFVCGFHVAFIATHFPAYLVDAGLAPVVAASALALIGLCNIAGSYMFGALGDRLPKKRVLSGIYLGRALTFSLFLLLPLSGASALAFGAAIGLLWLGTVPLTSGVVAQLFGTRYLGMLYGVVFLGHQVGAFLGAWLGGAVYDRAGSYLPVWVAALGLSLGAAAIHWLLDDRPARRLVEQVV